MTHFIYVVHLLVGADYFINNELNSIVRFSGDHGLRIIPTKTSVVLFGMLIKKTFLKLRLLYPCRSFLSHYATMKGSCSVVVKFCDTLDGILIKCDKNIIQNVQNACLRFICGIRRCNHKTNNIREAS